MPQTSFTIFLSDDQSLRVKLEVEENQVTDFMIQFEAVVGGEWMAVVRYDTSHGFLHRHRFWLPEKEQTDDLELRDQPAKDYTEPLEAAKRDLMENYQTYHRLMEEAT